MRISRVLVAIDFSGPSLAAARWVARELAPGAELVLAHVVRAPETPSFLRPFLPATVDLLSEIAPALAGGLHGVGESLAAPSVQIEMHAGDPAEALARAAVGAGAELVCVGRPRSRRGSARFGATTAHRLIARSTVPVLVVPAEQRGAPSRILAAIEDGRESHAVVDASLAIAAAHEAAVEGVHVLSPELESMVRSARLDAHDGPHARLVAAGARHALRDEEELLQLTREWIERQLRTEGRVQSTGHARVGDTGHEIMASAQALDAGLIVMGRGGDLSRRARCDVLPVGSTTRMVTWAASCPVLVVPGERVLTSTPAPRKIGFARGMTAAGGPLDAA